METSMDLWTPCPAALRAELRQFSVMRQRWRRTRSFSVQPVLEELGPLPVQFFRLRWMDAPSPCKLFPDAPLVEGPFPFRHGWASRRTWLTQVRVSRMPAHKFLVPCEAS